MRLPTFQTFTDVDDKIINRAKEEGITPQEVADKYIVAFVKMWRLWGETCDSVIHVL